MIEIKGYQIKSSFNELTISEYEKQVQIINDPKLDNIEKYCKIFNVLGLPADVIDDIEVDELIDIIRNLTLSVIDTNGMLRSVEINGFEYSAYEEGSEFKLKMGDMIHIEKIVKQYPDKYISKVVACIMKRTDLTKNEHYEKSHIDLKSDLLGDQLIVDFIGYMLHIQQKIVGKVKMLIDDNTTK